MSTARAREGGSGVSSAGDGEWRMEDGGTDQRSMLGTETTRRRGQFRSIRFRIRASGDGVELVAMGRRRERERRTGGAISNPTETNLISNHIIPSHLISPHPTPPAIPPLTNEIRPAPPKPHDPHPNISQLSSPLLPNPAPDRPTKAAPVQSYD